MDNCAWLRILSRVLGRSSLWRGTVTFFERWRNRTCDPFWRTLSKPRRWRALITSGPDRFLGSFTKVERRIINEMKLSLFGHFFFIEVALDRLCNRLKKLWQAVGLSCDTSHVHRSIPLRHKAGVLLEHFKRNRHGINIFKTRSFHCFSTP